jgi:DNA-binding CsgD family transcriptional regulator
MTPDTSAAFALDRRWSGGRHLRVIGSDPVATTEAPIIERSVELWVLRGALTRLQDGAGAVVVLDAGAGLGKTALIEQTARSAADADCLVRHAAPGPLERGFPYGVVRALLEAPARDRRHTLLDPAAAAAGALLLDGTVPDGDATTVAHSVLWLSAALARERPLVLMVDDAQWADRASLEVLAYLARRVEELPLLLVVAARFDDPDAAGDLLSLLGGARAATVLHPQPLSPSGAIRVIHRLAPNTPVELCRRCHEAVAGNPWLLHELARQIAGHGPAIVDDASRVTAIARNVVRRRLAELCPEDRAVAEALAAIGDRAPGRVLAAVAGVPAESLGATGDALRAAGLLGPDGMRFAHDLIAAAIAADIAPAARERLHRATARALLASGAGADAVADHLLRCGPQGDPEVSALMLRAATEAAGRGAPRTAAAYLERALCEHADGDDRASMLVALATVAFDAGLPDARERLLEALDEAGDRDTRIDVLTRLATLALVQGGDSGIAALLEAELAAQTDPRARHAIAAAALDTLLGRGAERTRRLAHVDPDAIADPVRRRVVLAHRARLATEAGALDAADAAALARAALDGDALLDDAWRRGAYHLATRALTMTDRAAEARRATARLRERATARGSLRMRAIAAWYAAELALRGGQIAEAESEARAALTLAGDDAGALTDAATDVLVCALAERGALDEAHALLREREVDRAPGLLHARARLALAEGDFERALADARTAGALRERQGRTNPTWTPWRSTAALALAHLGRRAEAAALADAELALAERFGAPVPIARALHARAVAEPDAAARIALCERALAVAGDGPALLETVRARLELGSTLRYVGRRVEARAALRPALADADAAGATLLAQRARRELVATGLRPRQAATEGAAALTPRQRQVCELAAAGKGNRAIAQELFLSIKTVETHLAAGFRKLGVNARAQLAVQLAS